MANDMTSNPWVIDTASATPICRSPVWLDKIAWEAPAAAGDTAVIQTSRGKPIFTFTSLATGAGIRDEMTWGHYISDGLMVPTLASGTLYVYVR